MGNVMQYKNFKARIMQAPKLTGDQIHQLPPGTSLEVYPVESFKVPPENWVKTGAFVVPVRPNFGLWFDWRENSAVNTAIVPTIKGVSPVTGMKTSGFHLEKYEDKCPKHNKSFIGDRFCEECGYKWPPQNYISAPNVLWNDGWFNQKDGTVRQFFFTEDELRDVAASLIGSDKIPAFGFAFYSPKERRPEPQIAMRGFNPAYPAIYGHYGSVMCDYPGNTFILGNSSQGVTDIGGYSGGYFSNNLSTHMKIDGPDAPLHAVYCCSMGSATPTASGPIASGLSDAPIACSAEPCSGSINLDLDRGYGSSVDGDSVDAPVWEQGTVKERLRKKKSMTKSMRSADVPVKEVSVGAGAKIYQNLSPDPYALNTWKEAPDSVMTIYFIFQQEFEKLKAGGLKNLEGSSEGMLAGLPVG
jgi:hypothetical protein